MGIDDTPFWFGAFADDVAHAVRQRTAGWLRTVLRASAVVTAASGLVGVLTKSSPSWALYGSFVLAIAVSLALDVAKRAREAGIALSLGFWVVASAAVFFLGGVHSPATFMYLPIVVTAALFWSLRAAAGLTVASIGVEMLAAYLDSVHLLPLPLRPPGAGPLLRIFAASITMTAVLVGVAIHCLRAALVDVRRSVLRSEQLLLEVPGVIAVFDRQGVLMAVSGSVAEKTGFTAAELVGKHVSRIEMFGPDRRAVTDGFRLLGTGPGDGVHKFELRHKDGSRAWAEARAQAFTASKRDSARRIVLYDVSRQMLAEERQSELEERLERSRRLEAMGLLVGGVTHDFNNLLTVIMSVGAVLDSQLSHDADARELLREINQSAARAATLARELLATRPADDADTIDVNIAIEEIGPVLSRMAGDGVHLVLKTHAVPCLVRIDKVELERVATNLVVNARDAMPRGGELVVEIARCLDPDAPADTTRRMVELSVLDSGVGMDPATKQRIFEPFYTTKGQAGSGLGLAAVDGIVARLGGQIRVDSEPGHGTRVRVLLPEAPPDDFTPSATAFGTRPE
jgi:PAS domain S-box-containing protein